ncbi:MAG TPA: hypothetical protein VEJ63_05710 [Planctomycetota bacterium]|nr:hypothetical protein [Planctomycetota bacterium]
MNPTVLSLCFFDAPDVTLMILSRGTQYHPKLHAEANEYVRNLPLKRRLKLMALELAREINAETSMLRHLDEFPADGAQEKEVRANLTVAETALAGLCEVLDVTTDDIQGEFMSSMRAHTKWIHANVI